MKIKIKIKSGKSEGKEISVKSWPFRIGRSEDCHLRPKSDTISRRHCELSLDGESIRVRDLGSKNGTLVNGDRIEGYHTVAGGDEIKVGKLEFEILAPTKEDTASTITKHVSAVDSNTVAEPVAKKAIQQPAAEKVATVGPTAKTDPGVKDAPSAADQRVKLSQTKDAAPGEMLSVSGFDDDDISGWLGDADTAEQSRRLADPETRQFRLDESQQQALKKAAEEKKAEEEKARADQEAHGKADKKKDKKEPGKLPKQHANTANSRQAAEDTLKKFFSRR